MKTEELIALRTEIENLNRKLAELSEEELKQVVGGLAKSPWSDRWSDEGYFGLTGSAASGKVE